MPKCYQYTADGYFAGEIEDYGLLPNNATYTVPTVVEGKVPRWTEKSWEQIEDHKGKSGYVNGVPTEIKEYGPLPAGWSDTPPPLSMDEAKEGKLRQIDAETSTSILAGFDYEVDGKTLHFAYDTNDQQNFADTANMVNFSLKGIPGVPESIPWNGWKIERDETGAEVSRYLVRLDLDANAFLALYMQGAMMHKAGLMELGGQRKAQVDAATTIEELEGI